MKEDGIMKRHHIIRLALLTLACILFLVTRAPAQIAARQLLCSPAPVPAGWVKVDVISPAGDCAGDGWVIEPYTNKIPGSAMVVCSDQPTPQGWEILGFATSTGQCSGGTQANDNIKSIRRLG